MQEMEASLWAVAHFTCEAAMVLSIIAVAVWGFWELIKKLKGK